MPPSLPPSPPPNAIFSPAFTVARVGTPARIMLSGVNMRVADTLMWVPADDPDGCDSANRTVTAATVLADDLVSMASTATFHAPGIFVLCYRWAHTRYLPFERQADIRAAASLMPQRPLPFGTAVGCSSTLTIQGVGFNLFGSLLPTRVLCTWGPLYDSTTPSVRNDTTIACATPSPSTLEPRKLPLHLLVYPATLSSAEALGEIPVYDIDVFDLNLVRPAALYPAGSAFNYEMGVTLSGAGLYDYGTPRCKFNGFVGGVGEASADGGHVNCSKPGFPNEQRDQLGPVPVLYAPNGQVCVPPNRSPPLRKEKKGGIQGGGGSHLLRLRPPADGAELSSVSRFPSHSLSFSLCVCVSPPAVLRLPPFSANLIHHLQCGGGAARPLRLACQFARRAERQRRGLPRASTHRRELPVLQP